MNWILYVALFPHGKRYFGVTSRSLEWRISSHKRTSKTRRTIFHKALAKYGDAVSFEAIATGDRSYILLEEYKAVEQYNTRDRRFGYNQAFGGALSPMLVPEIAKRHGDTIRGRKQPATQATLDALARARAHPDHAQKARAGLRAYWSDEANMEKHKKRMREMHADPEVKARVAERARKRAADPNSMFSIKRDRLKADPAWLAARSAQISALNADPEFKAAHSRRQSVQWTKLHAKPEFAAATKARMEAMNADPKFKEATRQRMAERWKDPAFRERMRLARTNKIKTQ